jgi:hypothetical protein
VAVHPYSAPVQQDRAGVAARDCSFHGSGDRGWEWGEDDLAAFAANLQDSVAVFLAQIGDVGSAGFEDP